MTTTHIVIIEHLPRIGIHSQQTITFRHCRATSVLAADQVMPFTFFTGEQLPWQTSEGSQGFGFTTSASSATPTSSGFAAYASGATPKPSSFTTSGPPASTLGSGSAFGSLGDSGSGSLSGSPCWAAPASCDSGTLLEEKRPALRQTGWTSSSGRTGSQKWNSGDHDVKEAEVVEDAEAVREHAEAAYGGGESERNEDELTGNEDGSAEGEATQAIIASATKTPARFPTTPFRFFELPAELRVDIYRELLAHSGHIDFRMKGNGFSCRPNQPLYPNILRVCREVYNEAKDMIYKENNVVFGLDIFHPVTNDWLRANGPIAPASLPHFHSTMILLFFGNGGSLAQDGKSTGVDWRSLQAMTGLRRVAISYVGDGEARDSDAFKEILIGEVVERLPAKCIVEFGAQTDAEKEYVEKVTDLMKNSGRAAHYQCTPYNFEGTVLQDRAKDALERQGCKSGSLQDYRFPERRAFSLKPLTGDGEGDKSIVLGS